MAYQPTLPPDPWETRSTVPGNSQVESALDLTTCDNPFLRVTTLLDARAGDLSSPNPKLQQIVEQACVDTGATGAAIALGRDGVFTCCATTGRTAPDFGVQLDTDYGLSAACLRTREVQCCHDADTDSRVDAAVCQSLGIRSVLIIPLEYEDCLFGLFEVFSPAAYIFTDRDIRAVRSLSWQILETLGIFPPPPPLVRPVELPQPETILTSVGRAVSSPSGAQPAHHPPEQPPQMSSEPAAPHQAGQERRDPLNTALTLMVIVVALLLGWMLGRVGWHLAIGRSTSHASSSTPAGAAGAAATKPTATPAAPVPVQTPSQTQTANGLVVYKNGKVIFQIAPVGASKRASGPSQNMLKDPPAIHPVQIAPEVADMFLVHRIEPEYPDLARQQHIQGPVVLAARVGEDGIVEQLRVLTGDSQLAMAAINAVRRWEFKPFAPKGRAQEFETQITVNFALPTRANP